MKSQKVDFDEVPKRAVGRHGLRVSVDVGETIQGKLQIDFRDEIAQHARLLPT